MKIPTTPIPLFSILHTSARPDKWRAVYDAWLSSCKNPNAMEYVLAVDKRWGFAELPTLRPQDKAVWNTGRKCYVDGVNIAANHATGLIFIVNADDQFPCPDWDRELIERVPPRAEFAIRVASGAKGEHARNIMIMPIISRPLYDRLGYVFYPEYESMYADQDLCELVQSEGILLNAWDLLFPHKHPVVDSTIELDAAYAAQNRKQAYQTGENILTRRRLTEFGKRLAPVMVTAPVTAPTPAPSTQPSSQSQAKEHIGVALPGDHFTSAWVFNWTRLFGDLLALFNVEPLFCYSTNVYATRTTIWEHFRAARPQPDYVLWIDDDNLVTFDNVVQLLQDLQARPDADIVTGWCWCGGDIYEQAESRISVGTLDSLGLTRFTPHSELMAGDEPLREIHFSGFPLLLMRRGVLQKLGPDAFAPLTGPQYSRGYAGEDVSFCLRAKEAGVRILVDRRVQVPHLKLRPAEPRVMPAVESAVA